VKIGLIDPQMICLKHLTLKSKKKKLTQVEHITCCTCWI